MTLFKLQLKCTNKNRLISETHFCMKFPVIYGPYIIIKMHIIFCKIDLTLIYVRLPGPHLLSFITAIGQKSINKNMHARCTYYPTKTTLFKVMSQEECMNRFTYRVSLKNALLWFLLHWRLFDDLKDLISVKNIVKHPFFIGHTFFKQNCVHTSLSRNCAMLKFNLESFSTC